MKLLHDCGLVLRMGHAFCLTRRLFLTPGEVDLSREHVESRSVTTESINRRCFSQLKSKQFLSGS